MDTKWSSRRWTSLALVAVWTVATNALAEPSGVDDLQVAPQVIPVESGTMVMFWVRIDAKDYIPGSAVLQKLDKRGKVTATIGRFHDDGKDGDFKAGDGIFAVRTLVTPDKDVALDFQASAAFKGTLFRNTAEVQMQVKAGVTRHSVIAMTEKNHLVFMSTDGSLTKTIPLLNRTVITGPGVKVTEEEVAYPSTSGNCAVVLTHQITAATTAPADEGETEEITESIATLYCAGEKVWSRTAKDGTSFLNGSDVTQMISQEGDTVVLVTVQKQLPKAPPIIEAVALTNKTVLEEQGDLIGVSALHVSANGRFFYCEGIDQARDYVVKFFDVGTHQSWKMELHPELYTNVEILENAAGSFTLRGDNTNLFVVPVN